MCATAMPSPRSSSTGCSCSCCWCAVAPDTDVRPYMGGNTRRAGRTEACLEEDIALLLLTAAPRALPCRPRPARRAGAAHVRMGAQHRPLAVAGHRVGAVPHPDRRTGAAPTRPPASPRRRRHCPSSRDRCCSAPGIYPSCHLTAVRSGCAALPALSAWLPICCRRQAANASPATAAAATPGDRSSRRATTSTSRCCTCS